MQEYGRNDSCGAQDTNGSAAETLYDKDYQQRRRANNYADAVSLQEDFTGRGDAFAINLMRGGGRCDIIEKRFAGRI